MNRFPANASPDCHLLWQPSLLHRLVAILLLMILPSHFARAQEPLISSGQSITIDSGWLKKSVIKLDPLPEFIIVGNEFRPAEPVVPIQVMGFRPGTVDPAYIVQRGASVSLGDSWYSSGIEPEVINAKLALHGLPASDYSRVLRWERDALRAGIWNRLLAMVKKAPASRTAIEEAICNSLTLELKKARVACAQASLDEYNKWNKDPYGYKAPAPFEYKAPLRSRVSFFLGKSTPSPSFDEFTAYGPAVYYEKYNSDEALARIASATSQKTATLVSVMTVPVVAASAAGAALGATLGPTALEASVRAVFPFALRTGHVVSTAWAETGIKVGEKIAARVATKVASKVGGLAAKGVLQGAALYSGPFAAIVDVIITATFEGLEVTELNETPIKLQEALTRANSATLDLYALSSDETVISELYSIFIQATAPDYPATEQAPPATATDRQWLVSLPYTSYQQQTPSITCLDWDGEEQSVRLMDNWFVVRNSEGNERLTLEFECQNFLKEPLTISIRNGTSVFVTNSSENNPSTMDATSFNYLDWNGVSRTASIGSASQGTALLPASLTATTQLGKFFSQTFTVQNPGPGTYSYEAVPVPVNYSYLDPVSPLPPGLTLSSSGVLSGTPTRAGKFEFQIAATNAPTNSFPVVKSYSLEVTSRPAPVPAGLVASYRFQDNLLDTTGSNHASWAAVTPAYATGQVGKAASLTFGNAILLPDNVFPSGARSFEIWFKTGQFGAILGQRDPAGPSAIPALYIGTDGKLRATFFYNGTGTVVTSATAVNDNTWHHVALTHNGTQEKVYLDGVDIGGRTFTNVNFGSGNYRYTLGAAGTDGWPGAGGPVLYFSGLLDEAAIYNTALTAAQVQNLYSAGSAGKALLTVDELHADDDGLPYSHAVGDKYTASLEARFQGTNVTSSSTASVVSGTLPFGLAFEGMKLIGIPRSAGVFTFTTAVTGPDGLMGERSFTITITGPIQQTPEGLVAWWTGDNTLESLPGNALPLTSEGAYADGFRGKAFVLSNSSPANFLNLPSGLLSLNSQQPSSFEAWFMTTTSGSLLRRTSSVHTGAVIEVGSDGRLASQLFWNPGQAPLTTSFRVDDGAWHHVAATYGAGEERLYVDGKLIAVRTGLKSPSGQTAPPTYQFGGNFALLDEPAVYNRAISQADVTNIFTSGSNGKSILKLAPDTLPLAFAGDAYQQTLTATSLGAAPGPLTWSVTYGQLPEGLTLSPGGVLSGTPTKGSNRVITLRAADNNGLSGARNYVLTVVGMPSALPSGIIAWWPGEATPEDNIGTQHATLSGNVSYTAGVVGSAFAFDGTGSRVVLPANAFPSPATNPGNSFTFETWFQTRLPGVILGRQEMDFPLLPFYYVPAIYVGQNGRLHAQMFWNGSTSPLSSTARVDDGKPHHVAVTFAGGVQQLYLDGVLIGSRSGFTQQHHSILLPYRYQLGTGYTLGWPQGNGYWMHFNGFIDEPAVYNRALSASEIAAMVSAGNAGKANATPSALVTLPRGRVSESYRSALNYTSTFMKLSAGFLPPGLEINTSGFLGGTTEVAGDYQFTMATLNAQDQWTLQNYRLIVDGQPAPRLRDAGWFSGEGNPTGFLPTESLTNSGVTYTSEGMVGQAFNFTDSASLRIPNVPFPAPSGAWSFETWFRTPRSGVILSQNGTGGYVPMLYVGSDGLLRGQPYWSGSNTTLTSTARVDDNLWHHAAITYANGVRTLYLDGEAVATATAPGQSYGSSLAYDLGAGNATGWPATPPVPQFLGQLDECQVYDFALSPEDVSDIRAAGYLGKSRLTLTDTLADTVAGEGLNYSGSIAMTNQPGNFTYQITRGRLPAGLALASNGTLTGSATTAGTYGFRVLSTSLDGVKNVRDYQVTAASNIRFRPASTQHWWSAEGNGTNWVTAALPAVHTGSYTSGIVGQGFSYDSSLTQFTTLPANALPTPGSNTAFTVDLWFRAAGSGGILGQRSPLGGNGEPVSGYVPMVYVGADGLLRVQTLWSGTVQPVESTTSVIDGTWHHLASTFDGSAMRVYLNGELIGSRSGISSVSYSSSYALELGRVFIQGWNFGGSGWEYFDGSIDEVSTWNRALTAQEISFIAACGSAGKATARFTGTLPEGVRGRPYLQDIGMDGQPLPVVSSATGTLPPGLSYGHFTTGGGGLVLGTPRNGMSGTPTTPGTWTFRLSAQDFLGLVGVSNSSVQRIEEDFTLSINALTNNAAYDFWAGAAGLTGPNALPSAAPANDGTTNLLKFAFNLDPNKGDLRLFDGLSPLGLPDLRLVDTPGGKVFRFDYPRRKNSGLTYQPQTSTTLGTFAAPAATPVITPINDDWDRVTVEIPATSPNLFGRLQVTQ